MKKVNVCMFHLFWYLLTNSKSTVSVIQNKQKHTFTTYTKMAHGHYDDIIARIYEEREARREAEREEERRDQERRDQERRDQERQEAERQEAERQEAERQEAERQEAERRDQEYEKALFERIECVRIEKEREERENARHTAMGDSAIPPPLSAPPTFENIFQSLSMEGQNKLLIMTCHYQQLALIFQSFSMEDQNKLLMIATRHFLESGKRRDRDD